jgi:hypothetical protein
MRLPGILLFVLVGLVTDAGTTAPRAADPDPSWEKRACKALEEGDRVRLRQLAAEFRKLSPETRSALPLRIREDSVEFVFRGVFPGDQFSAEMLEYLVCAPGKDYESLLVAPPAEQKRVQALQGFFATHVQEGRRKRWSARLVWTGEDGPRSVDLTDLLILVGPGERDQFLDHLGVNSAGLGGDINIKADPAPLPRKRFSARLYLTLRIAPGS